MAVAVATTATMAVAAVAAVPTSTTDVAGERLLATIKSTIGCASTKVCSALLRSAECSTHNHT